MEKPRDEAQFYQAEQVEQLGRVVDDLGADVYAFGLLTTFQGELFVGTRRLLELAVDLGARLLPAFRASPTGIPYGTVNLRWGVPPGETPFRISMR